MNVWMDRQMIADMMDGQMMVRYDEWMDGQIDDGQIGMTDGWIDDRYEGCIDS